MILGIGFFLLAVLFINFIKPEITNTRAVADLDCTNTTITDGSKMTCLVVDIALPGFIIAVFMVAGGIITSRFLT